MFSDLKLSPASFWSKNHFVHFVHFVHYWKRINNFAGTDYIMLTPEIRDKLEARFGRPIRYSKDCEALALSIEHTCKERISATTLKRLFGFAKNIDNPRLFTLDLLAIYVGYPDWSSLLTDAGKQEEQKSSKRELIAQKNNTDPDIYELNHQLVISLTTQTIDTGKIIQLCQRHGKRPEIITFISEIIHMAGRIKHLQFLKQVFSLPDIFNESLHEQGDIYYIGQTLGMILRANPDLCYELTETYAAGKKSQQYLVEWFVDEDYLTGYYGELLDKYHSYKKKNVQERLFYYALKYSQAMQSGDFLMQKDWFDKIKKLKIFPGIHAIPAGRYAGICLAEEKEIRFSVSSPYYTFIRKHMQGTRYEEAIHFFLYLNRYLFKGQRTDWMTGLLKLYEENMKNRPEKSKSHWGLRTENDLFIYMAYAYYLAGNKREAKKLIRSVDPNLFEAFMYKQLHNDYVSILNMLLK